MSPRFVFWLVPLFWLAFQTPAALAYDPYAPDAVFDPAGLTGDEVRFVQAALALSGHYNGVLDGDWGRGSQRGLEQAYRTENTGPPTNLYVSVLAFVGEAAFIEKGWMIEPFDPYGVSMLVPMNTVQLGGQSDTFFNLEDTSSSLRYSLAAGDVGLSQSLHDYALEAAAMGHEPYVLRRDGLAVTSVMLKDGTSLYTRSDQIGKEWTTVTLSASAQDAGPLAMVMASIAPGPGRPLGLPAGGLLRQGVQAVAAVAAQDGASAASPAGAAPAGAPSAAAPPSPATDVPPPDTGGGSGTGFIVDGQGHVVTNAHVVESCGSVSIDGLPAQTVALDPAMDLAVLRAPHLAGAPHARFDAMPARLNSDVTVAGYPLSDLLGGLNITRGAVSSDRGMGGDMTRMQITAPVQPGNSGGPVFSRRGTVVGVVVSKLNAQAVAEAVGDIPQNVNFAIRGEMARLFLSQNGVEATLGLDAAEMPPEELATLATQVTRLILCE